MSGTGTTSSPSSRLARAPGVPGLLLTAALFGAASSLVGVAAWVVLARGVGVVLLQPEVPDLLATTLILAALFGARALLGGLRDVAVARRALRIKTSLRGRCLVQLTRLGPLAPGGERPGELVLALGRGLDQVEPFYSRFLPQAAHAVVGSLIMFVGVAVFDPLSALVLAFSGPLLLLLLWLVGVASARAADRQWLALTRLGGSFAAGLRVLGVLHTFGRAGRHRAYLEEAGEAYRVSTLRVLRVAMLNGFVLELAATLSTALVAVLVGLRLFEGRMEFVPALSALLLVPEFFAPLRQLGADHHAAMEARAGAAPLFALLDRPAPVAGTLPPPAGVPALALRDVGVDLGETAALRGLGLEVPAGAFLALVGASGAGKTTLLNVLLGYAPYTGSVRVGGAELRDLDPAAWRAGVALVSQHPYLTSGTVAENLRLARPEATPAELEAAVRAAGFAGVVARLPRGLDTPLGDGGVRLSGGERARLALARALLRGARLLLLDEPTAQLDAHGAREVMRAVRSLARGRTVILVTHRAEDAAQADLVAEIGGGRLVSLRGGVTAA